MRGISELAFQAEGTPDGEGFLRRLCKTFCHAELRVSGSSVCHPTTRALEILKQKNLKYLALTQLE